MHTFCRLLLRNAREEAKQAGVKIPIYSGSCLSPEEYAIYLGDKFYTEVGACCSYHARAEAINEYVEEMKPSDK